jgi:CubicO group peptidase (beta-lactamase class C family)
MIFEGLEIIWRETGSQPSHPVNDEALRRIVLERARNYRRKILRRNVSEIATNALVVGLLLGVGLWSGARNGWSFSLDSAPMVLMAIGYTFVSACIFASRQRQKKREAKFDDSIHGNLRKLIANTDYQIRLKSKFIWWYLLPIVPGFILLAVANAKSGPVVPWIFGVFFSLIFGIIYWENRDGLRKELIPQKRELESLLAGLENRGQTVELRPTSTDSNVVCGNRKVRWIISVAVTAVCFGAVGWLMFAIFMPPKEPRAPEFDDVSAFGERDIARIDVWLQEQVELSAYPSLSVAIVRDGQIVYQGVFGFENTWANRKATTNTAYHVASVTKAFTASLAVLLHEHGVIDLDQPVVKYLPKGVSISTKPELGATITLRQLASHTSGLPRGIPGRVQSVEGRYQLEPQRLYDLLADVTLDFDPGTDELYSNLGFGLLGHAIELATDKPLDQLLQEVLCDPLKLERTAFHVDAKFPVATGYSTPPQLPEGHSYRERMAGSGGLVTSAGDLAKFLAAQMKPGLFTREMLAQLHTPSMLSNGSMAGTALGWSVRSNEFVGRILKKNGGRNNASAWIGFAPDHGVGVAVVANCGAPDVDPIGYWLLERSVPGGRNPVTKYGYAKVSPFTGVRWENDRPIVRVQDRWSPLVSIDGIQIDRIMEFAQSEFGGKARMRLAEDLVELLSKMGHDPEWKVTLGLKKEDGRVEQMQIRMTEENRTLVRDGRRFGNTGTNQQPNFQ